MLEAARKGEISVVGGIDQGSARRVIQSTQIIF
jgi:hypothetical protein